MLWMLSLALTFFRNSGLTKNIYIYTQIKEIPALLLLKISKKLENL